MLFDKEVRFLVTGILMLFLLVVGAAIYWAIIQAPILQRRDDNPRQVDRLAEVRRGQILDRNGIVLAYSAPDEQGIQKRFYPLTATYSALGYYSLRYGAGRAEAAYDPVLGGDDETGGNLQTFLEQDILHQPQVGSDVQLTLDSDFQEMLVNVMQDYSGAGILLSLPGGQVRAMVSVPTYNPNKLDTQWDEFVEMEGDPFFNRVTQGRYQPGHLLQIPLIIGMMIDSIDLSKIYSAMALDVILGDLVITCTTDIPLATLTLSQAFIYGCPGVFAMLADDYEPRVGLWLEPFTLDSGLTLEGFEEIQDEVNEATTESSFLENVVGQGNIQISPLQMASIIASVINKGNVPQPYLLQGIRSPGADAWQTTSRLGTSTPLMAEPIAQQLRDLLNESVGLISLGLQGQRIGGKTALAFSGEETHVWFVGYSTTDQDSGYALAIVLENVDDPHVAAEIGIEVLLAVQGV